MRKMQYLELQCLETEGVHSSRLLGGSWKTGISCTIYICTRKLYCWRNKRIYLETLSSLRICGPKSVLKCINISELHQKIFIQSCHASQSIVSPYCSPNQQTAPCNNLEKVCVFDEQSFPSSAPFHVRNDHLESQGKQGVGDCCGASLRKVVIE